LAYEVASAHIGQGRSDLTTSLPCSIGFRDLRSGFQRWFQRFPALLSPQRVTRTGRLCLLMVAAGWCVGKEACRWWSEVGLRDWQVIRGALLSGCRAENFGFRVFSTNSWAAACSSMTPPKPPWLSRSGLVSSGNGSAPRLCRPGPPRTWIAMFGVSGLRRCRTDRRWCGCLRMSGHAWLSALQMPTLCVLQGETAADAACAGKLYPWNLTEARTPLYGGASWMAPRDGLEPPT
jgi:hypothetical protein